jgi:hypothetical protein
VFLKGDIASASAFIITALNTHCVDVFSIFERPPADINPRFILIGPSVAFVSRRKGFVNGNRYVLPCISCMSMPVTCLRGVTSMQLVVVVELEEANCPAHLLNYQRAFLAPTGQIGVHTEPMYLDCYISIELRS